jgi:hypothetical protein
MHFFVMKKVIFVITIMSFLLVCVHRWLRADVSFCATLHTFALLFRNKDFGGIAFFFLRTGILEFS